ncbi:MAG: (2Fe-2S)-binding protein [Anaerolineales bacterium]|nr:(2Fe-2S)-binding protein [Anaerolineales bacterium]
MITLTINGTPVEVPEGATVLRAAEKAGIHVPTLCDHEHLSPFGGCRLCIVEVEGFRLPVASCTLPASEGMVVTTESDNLKNSRQTILSLLFSERNHFCPFCQLSGGDCELQNAAYEQEMNHWPIQPTWNTYSTDTSHPYFVLDNNRCILCRRCVRACAEMSGNHTLNIAERGSDCMVVADSNVPLGESTCVSCGSCVQVCPTGALINRQSAYKGHQKNLSTTKTICTGCSLGCGLVVYHRDNQIMRIEGDWDAPINAGTLCKLGRFIPMTDERERITAPMVRKNGKLEATTWDEAFTAVMEQCKKGEVAAIASTRLSVESLSYFKDIFANTLASNMVTSTEEGLSTANGVALAAELGENFEGTLADMTADYFVVSGVDLINDHEVAGFFIKRVLPAGIPLVVIDGNGNKMKEIANFNFEKTSALGKLEAALSSGKDQDAALAEAAKMLSIAKKPVFVYGAKIDVDGLKALVSLAKAAKGKVVGIKGGANSLAAAQLGLDSTFALNEHKVVYAALGDEAPGKELVKKLENAPFLVIQASYSSALTEKADVVLPVAIWSEQDGHYLNLDGRLQDTHKIVDAPDGVLSNQAVLEALGEKAGAALNGSWKKALTVKLAPVAIQA